MYQDENNLYHYSYSSDDQPGQSFEPSGYQSGPQQPVQEMKPVKKNRMGLKVTALALVCALLGGAVGGGAVIFGAAAGQGQGQQRDGQRQRKNSPAFHVIFLL